MLKSARYDELWPIRQSIWVQHVLLFSEMQLLSLLRGKLTVDRIWECHLYRVAFGIIIVLSGTGSLPYDSGELACQLSIFYMVRFILIDGFAESGNLNINE